MAFFSTVKTTRVWNGLSVEETTNTDTGVIELRSASFLGSEGVLLATGDAKGNWSYDDQAGFRRRYNNKQKSQGKPTLSQKEFNKKFFTKGVKLFNNDRAAVLNNEENYSGVSEAIRNQVAFAENGIPGVKNPETGEKNNSNGDSVEDPDKNQGDENEDFELQPIEEKPTGTTTNQNLRYPLGQIPDLGYDYVTFTAHEYKAGGLSNLTSSSGLERLGAALETVSLPMLPGREEANSVSFGSDSMNIIQAAAGRIALNTLNVTSGEGMVAGLGELGTKTKEELNGFLQNEGELKSGIIAYFAGQAAQAPGLLTRATGSVLNPNMELLFKGPNLRTFNFAFKFRPRFEDESKAVKEIIRIFKRNMAVQRSASEAFLLTPNIFSIKYIHNNGEEHPYMNRIKPCMLASFNVNYTPDNSYMTYQDGAMTGYDVTMTFNEIVPIYADEQQAAGGTGF
jgi:hypothetical protein